MFILSINEATISMEIGRVSYLHRLQYPKIFYDFLRFSTPLRLRGHVHCDPVGRV